MEIGKIVFGPSDLQPPGKLERKTDSQILFDALLRDSEVVGRMVPKKKLDKQEKLLKALREYVEASQYWTLEPHDRKEQNAFFELFQRIEAE